MRQGRRKFYLLVAVIFGLFFSCQEILAAENELLIPNGGIRLVWLQVVGYLACIGLGVAILSLLVSAGQYFWRVNSENRVQVVIDAGYAVLVLITAGAILVVVGSEIMVIAAGGM